MSRRDRDSSGYGKDRDRSRSRDRESEGLQRDTRFDYGGGDRGAQKDEFGRSRNSMGHHNDRGPLRVEASARASSNTLQFSTSHSDHTTVATTKEKKAAIEKPEDGEDEDAEMMRMMGFGGFTSSKGKHVADNDNAAAGTARVKKAHKYRQYMNRRGGFNQSLAKVD
jgi:U4/U6.U5 tri-snRNP-associated protein 3